MYRLRCTKNYFASTSTTLVSFCALANCADGGDPGHGSLITDAKGDLFGTTQFFGANSARGTPAGPRARAYLVRERFLLEELPPASSAMPNQQRSGINPKSARCDSPESELASIP